MNKLASSLFLLFVTINQFIICQSTISVNITNEVNVDLLLNQQEMNKVSPGIFSFSTNDLIPGINQIEVEATLNALNGTSALDMVLLMKGLFTDEPFTPAMAIAADVDLNGSVTTKDLFIIRKTILGIISPPPSFSELFLLESSQDLTDFDRFDFINDFTIFEFDETDNFVNDELNFQIHKYSDLNSTFAKNDILQSDKATITLDNQSVVNGEEISVKIRIDPGDHTNLAGCAWKFLHPGLVLQQVSADSRYDLLWNEQNEDETAFTFLSLEKEKFLEFELIFRATKTGLLSDMLQLDPEFQNEQVTHQRRVFPISLAFNSLNTMETRVFPNPIHDHFFVQLPLTDVPAKISIYNAIGRKLHEESASESLVKINTDKFRGEQVILVQVATKGERITKKLMLF